jgi:hypothetical protein
MIDIVEGLKIKLKAVRHILLPTKGRIPDLHNTSTDATPMIKLSIIG